ncbi:MAG: DUF6804 family protein [Bacteroidota bacterium]
MKASTFFILTAFLLVLAAGFDWPYGFYQFLRIVVTVAAVIGMVVSISREAGVWCAFMGFTAILFFPGFGISFERETWVVIDVIVSMLFIVTAIRFRKPREAVNEAEKSTA